MILADIYIPATDKTYDFLLDENAIIDKLVLELVAMLSKREKNECVEYYTSFSLYSFRIQDRLLPTETLKSYGIGDGEKLMLV